MKINQKVLAVSIIIILFGTVLISSVLGLWKTKNTNVPGKYQSGQFKDEYNPADIKGSYTFGDISEVFNLPIEDLTAAFAVKDTADVFSFQVKELESIYKSANESGKEVGTDSVRLFVAFYKGLPITLSGTTYLPKPARAILLNEGNMTDEQKTFMESHLTEPQNTANTANPSDNSSPAVSSQSAGGESVNGKTTFNDILAMGIGKEDIEAAINKTIPNTSVLIKDFCADNGIEFSSVKTQIQNLVDKK